jgi:hypothetical protein
MRIIALFAIILFVGAHGAWIPRSSQVCSQEGGWPATPAGQKAFMFCNPLHNTLIFREMERVMGRDLPLELEHILQNAFESISQSRKCDTNGTWEEVIGSCPTAAGCWRADSFTLDNWICPSGYSLDGLLCYPNCKSGYYGVGPVCWERCPPDSDDIGLLCTAKGPMIQQAENHCPWFDACGLINHKDCTKCPFGYDKTGCICTKTDAVYVKGSYGRGVGKVPSFPGCSSGFTDCGILCARDRDTCAKYTDMVLHLGISFASELLPPPLSSWVDALVAYPLSEEIGALLELILAPHC